jgi:hypothetical protein
MNLKTSVLFSALCEKNKRNLDFKRKVIDLERHEIIIRFAEIIF